MERHRSFRILAGMKGFARVAAAVPVTAVADPALNLEPHPGAAARGGGRRRERGGVPGDGPVRLFAARSVPAAAAAGGRRAGAVRSGPCQRGHGGAGAGRPADPRTGRAVQRGRGGVRRTPAGSGAQELPAQLSRVRRGALVPPRHRGRSRGHADAARRSGTVRHRSAVRGRPAGAVRGGGYLRGTCGCRQPPSSLAVSAGATLYRQPVGLQLHHRQGRPAPHPGAVAERPWQVRLRVRGGGPRRVVHRCDLGCGRVRVRERRVAGRVAPLRA